MKEGIGKNTQVVVQELRLVQQEWGLLDEYEIKRMIKGCEDSRVYEKLDKTIIVKKVRIQEMKVSKCTVLVLGNILQDKEGDQCRFLYCQLNNALMKR